MMMMMLTDDVDDLSLQRPIMKGSLHGNLSDWVPVLLGRIEHEMRTVVIDDPSICQSFCSYILGGVGCPVLRPLLWTQCAIVSLSVMWVGYVWMAEGINILFGVETPGDPRNIVLDGVPIPLFRRGVVGCDLCQITLTTCLGNYCLVHACMFSNYFNPAVDT